MKNLINQKNELIGCALKLSASHLVFGTWGNLSLRIDEESFLITPSGVDYKLLTPENIIVVNVKDASYEGNIKPSSERRMHAHIYQKRSDIKAIIHTHSTNIQILSSLHLPFIKDEKIIYPVSKYAVSSTKKLAKNVVKHFDNYDGVIIANHGFVVGGSTIDVTYLKALETEEALERKLTNE